jgi:Mn2+/Fe2+ NRAMP family transporter
LRLGLVWSPLVLFPILVAMQLAAARIGLTKRKGLAAVAKEALPAWLVGIVLVPVLIASTFTLGADLHAMASAANLLVPVPTPVLLAVITTGSFAAMIRVPYARYRRVLLVFALAIVAYFGVIVVADVNWSEVLKAFTSPRLGFNRRDFGGLIAMVGALASPFIVVWQVSAEVEERVLTGRRDLRSRYRSTVAVVSGLAVAVVAATAIVIATAATLPAARITTVGTVDEAARALRPLLGSSAQIVFAIGILGTGLVAVPVIAGGAAFIVSELLGWRRGLGRHWRDAPGFYGLIAAAALAAIVLSAVGVPPVRALFLASVANGLAAPLLMLTVAYLGRSRRVLGDQRIGALITVLVVSAATAAALLPVLYVVSP